MHETPFSFSNLESPAPGSTLPPGRHELRGWVWPKPGGHFVNVRARVDGRVFTGVHGRPRADLAAHFQIGSRLALAEFSIPFELRPGTNEVGLEVLTIEGVWCPFQSVPFQVTASADAVPPPPPPKPLHWHDFARGLEFILRSRRFRPDAPWTRLASELAAELPVNQDVQHPPQP